MKICFNLKIMILRRIQISFLLIYLVILLNPTYVLAMDVSDRYINPGTMGRENIDSFKPNPYQQAVENRNLTKDKLKIDKNVKDTNNLQNVSDVKYNLGATKMSGQSKTFRLNKIVLEGNTKIKSKKLESFITPYEGKDVSMEDLNALCEKITYYYRKQGYITSRAKILTQRVDNGILTVTVDEGKYGDIAITGNKWAKEKYLNNILSVNNVKKDEVLNVNNLQSAIEEINNKSYIRGNVVINNGKAQNFNDIKLAVQDRLPLDFNVDWNNYGAEMVGQQRAALRLSYDNLTGYGDSLYGGAILGNNNYGSLAGYSIPLNSKGTTLNLGLSTYNVNYGGIYRPLRMYGKWYDYSIGVTQPLLRKGKWAVDSSVNFDICNVNQGLGNFGDLSSQKLRVLRAGIGARRNDEKGVWTSNVLVSTGIPLLGATDSAKYGGGPDGNFVKVNAGINRIQFMPKRSMFLFSLNGQYAPNELMSPEKLAFGGMNGRGYETASLMGDSGIYGTLEFRTPVPGLRKILPNKLKPFEDNLKLGYFYDFGVIHDLSGFASLYSGKNTNLLQSVGVGLHFPVSRLLTANIDLGIPIGNSAFFNKSARVTFSVSSSLQNVWKWKKMDNQTL
jgi:hemolysin activation/secretion protein